MSYTTLTFTNGFTFDPTNNFLEISLAKKEYVSNIIIQFPKLTKEFRFVVAFSEDNFVTTKYIWSNSSHSKNSLSVGIGSSTTANTNYISYFASSTEANKCEILYKNVTIESGVGVTKPKRFMATSIRIYVASAQIGTTFELSEVKPTIQSLADDFQGSTLTLTDGITIKTISGTSDIVQLDSTGLRAWSGANSSINFTKLTATGLEIYNTKSTGSATTSINIGYLGVNASGTAMYGAWFPRIYIGGTGFLTAPFQTDDNGNVSISATSQTISGNASVGGTLKLTSAIGSATLSCNSAADQLDLIGAFYSTGKYTIQKSVMPTGYTVGDCYIHLGGTNEILNGTALIGFGYVPAASPSVYPPAYIGFLETVYSSYEKGDLVFGTRDVVTNTQATERLRITSAGKFGLNNSSPWGRLHIGAKVPAGTEHATYKAHLVDTFNITTNSGAAGYDTYLLNNAAYSTTWKTILAGYSQYIELNQGITLSVTGSLAADATITWINGIHINSTGQTTIFKQLLMTDYRTTEAHARFGSIALQGYGLNNGWLFDNAYYNSGYKYQNTGYAQGIYFNTDGSFNIMTAPSGTAGNPVSFTTKLSISNLGAVAITNTLAVTNAVTAQQFYTYSYNNAGASAIWLRFAEIVITSQYQSTSFNVIINERYYGTAHYNVKFQMQQQAIMSSPCSPLLFVESGSRGQDLVKGVIIADNGTEKRVRLYVWSSGYSNHTFTVLENAGVDTTLVALGVIDAGTEVLATQPKYLPSTYITGQLINYRTADQALFYGYSPLGGTAMQHGSILIGNTTSACGRLQYSYGGATIVSLDNTYNDNNSIIQFRLKTAGTPITPLVIYGNGLVTTIGDIESGGQHRAKGWRSASATGHALETGISGGTGYVISYNITTALYQPLSIEGTSTYISCRNTAGTVVGYLAFSGTTGSDGIFDIVTRGATKLRISDASYFYTGIFPGATTNTVDVGGVGYVWRKGFFGNLLLQGNEISENVNATDSGVVWINYRSINELTNSWYRDFKVGNGQGIAVLTVDGSSKLVTLAGSLQIGNSTNPFLYMSNDAASYSTLEFDDAGVAKSYIQVFSPTWGTTFGSQSRGAINLNGNAGVTIGAWNIVEVAFPKTAAAIFNYGITVSASGIAVTGNSSITGTLNVTSTLSQGGTAVMLSSGGAFSGFITSTSYLSTFLGSTATGTTYFGGSGQCVCLIQGDPHVAFNAYYSGGWKVRYSSTTSYTGAIHLAPSTGLWTIYTGSAAATDASTTLISRLTITNAGAVDIPGAFSTSSISFNADGGTCGQASYTGYSNFGNGVYQAFIVVCGRDYALANYYGSIRIIAQSDYSSVGSGRIYFGNNAFQTAAFFNKTGRLNIGTTTTDSAASTYYLYVNGAAYFNGTIYQSGTAVSLSGHTHAYLSASDYATTATANKLVMRDANGYIFGVYLNSSCLASSTTASCYWYETGSDGYFRKKSLADVKAEIVTAAAVNAVLGGSTIYFNFNTYTYPCFDQLSQAGYAADYAFIDSNHDYNSTVNAVRLTARSKYTSGGAYNVLGGIEWRKENITDGDGRSAFCILTNISSAYTPGLRRLIINSYGNISINGTSSTDATDIALTNARLYVSWDATTGNGIGILGAIAAAGPSGGIGIKGYAGSSTQYSGYFQGGMFNISLGTPALGNLNISNMYGTATYQYSVVIDSSNNIVKYTSSARYKHNIRPFVFDDKFYLLEPRIFCSNDHPSKDELGLIAEEVNCIYPDLVPKDELGRPDAVQYMGMNVPLIAATKYHKTILDQHTTMIVAQSQTIVGQTITIANMQSDINELKAAVLALQNA